MRYMYIVNSVHCSEMNVRVFSLVFAENRVYVERENGDTIAYNFGFKISQLQGNLRVLCKLLSLSSSFYTSIKSACRGSCLCSVCNLSRTSISRRINPVVPWCVCVCVCVCFFCLCTLLYWCPAIIYYKIFDVVWTCVLIVGSCGDIAIHHLWLKYSLRSMAPPVKIPTEWVGWHVRG